MERLSTNKFELCVFVLYYICAFTFFFGTRFVFIEYGALIQDKLYF